MLRIHNHRHDGNNIKLTIPEETNIQGNIFTVVIGKNGIGKSRLLADIAKTLSQEKTKANLYGETHPYSDRDSTLIAISTSPFDKFPSHKKRLEPAFRHSPYRYVGMRGEGIFPASSAVSLISSASKGLLEKITSGSNNTNLLFVFKSLNFLPTIDFIFKPSYLGKPSSNDNLHGITDHSLIIDLQCLERDYGIYIDKRYHSTLENFSTASRHEAFNAIITIERLLKQKKAVELSVNFEDGKSFLDGALASSDFIKSMLVLLQFGLMRLMDLRLQKIGYGELSVRRASSGEQCLLVLIFGIAGHINDGSLILIDEPEISLHPKWQEEFITLLISSFSSYSRCQFIIATHSPQIISRLSKKGCFVTSLSENKVYNAEHFANKSADYQLAELFDAPGMMNEYISRLAFSLLAKVKAKKSLDKDLTADLNRLLQLNLKVEESDPIKELANSVAEVCYFYANNK